MTLFEYLRKKLNIADAPSSATRDPKKSIIKKLGMAFVKSSGPAAKKDFQEPDFDLTEITKAYNTDSYVRQAIDKYVDLMFKAGWSITGKNQKAVDYIKIRLAVMAEATQTPNRQFLSDIAEDLVKFGNVFIVKARAKGQYVLPSGVTATNITGSAPVAGYFVLPPTTMKIARDENGNIVNYQQEVSGKEPIEFKPEDIIHITWKKERGQAFGVPFLLPVLDDVKVLRQIEEDVVRLIYRNLFPLMQYQVGLDKPGFEATPEEVEAVREEIRNLPLDGGVVIPERHNISIVGSEGEALDVSEYLKYFRRRVFTGLGVSETAMGIGDCYDAATQTLTNNGWKYYWEIMDGDEIATYNPESNQIEYHVPVDGYSDHIFMYNGTMYHINNDYVDIMVSPGHDMWIKDDEWKKIKIQDLYNNCPDEFSILEDVNVTRRVKKEDIKQIDYDGIMYCYNVPNHLFVTMRNGKVTIQGNTANRGTAESMNTEMHDRIKAFQSVMAEAIDYFIITELLREGGFDPLIKPEDDVDFQFKEIDLDRQTKIENSVNQMWMGNIYTFEEARQALGKDPVVDENRLFFNMVTIAQSRAKTAATIDPSADLANNPANKSGATKTAAMVESVVGDLLQVNKYSDQLQYHWELTRSDVVEMVKQYYINRDRSFGGFKTQEIEGIIHLTKESMQKVAEKYIRHAFISGVDAARIQVGKGVPNVNYEAGIRENLNYHREITSRLLDEDLKYLITIAIRSSTQENAIVRIMGAFQALKFRLSFIANSELYRAYNYGFIKCAYAMGYDSVSVIEAGECETCIVSSGVKISTINVTVSSPLIPPFHPNCTCLLQINGGVD